MAKQLTIDSVAVKNGIVRFGLPGGGAVIFEGKAELETYLEGRAMPGDELQKAVFQDLLDDGTVDSPIGYTSRTYEEQPGAKKI